MKNYLTLLLMVFILQNPLFSKNPLDKIENSNAIHYKKLYLHTDREMYFQNDTIWYKAYYLNGQTQQFVDGFYNLYVSLIDKQGNAVCKQVIQVLNGVAGGNLTVPNSIKSGDFTLRAYTEFQKSIGEDAFFHKIIKISNIDEFIKNKKEPKTVAVEKIDVSFLPEGGFLLEEASNTVAFKAINENGQGIPIEGKILNNKGELVSVFKSSYKGMGKFYLKPLANEKYTISINDYPDFHYEFENIKSEGIKVELKRKENKEIFVQIISNASRFENNEYYFAILSKGKVIYYNKLYHNATVSQIKIDQKALEQGINKFVLFDNDFNPISERLFFSNSLNINKIDINLTAEIYNTRSEVEFELIDDNQFLDGEFSNLSLSIIDKKAILNNNPSLNILSSLLIDSEIKGTVETPADFFVNDEFNSAENKLDILMLTQGWSQYVWDNIPEIGESLILKKSEGITVKGQIKQLIRRGTVSSGDVILGLYNDNYHIFAESTTDENGNFTFPNLVFTDTANVFMQAKNSKGQSWTEIQLDPIFSFTTDISQIYLPYERIQRKVPVKVLEDKYYNDIAIQDYNEEIRTIHLQEVVVTAPRIEKDDGHFRIYGSANTSLKLEEKDLAYRDVFSWLDGRVAGVRVYHSGTEYKIVIRGGAGSLLGEEKNPLILVDNMPAEMEFVQTIPMNQIDKVEVLKNANEVAAFGMRGAAGVISIYLKKDMARYDEKTRGILADKLIGYASYKEFYSPKYTNENLNSKKPDHRITLYWNPNLNTVNGKVKGSFFTSDDISNYKIFVEGINSTGKICIGSAEFKVVDKLLSKSK